MVKINPKYKKLFYFLLFYYHGMYEGTTNGVKEKCIEINSTQGQFFNNMYGIQYVYVPI